MSQQELLTEVLRALNSLGTPYMLTGSIVSSMQGEPRATHDLDVVVVLDAADVERVVGASPPPRYYVDAVDARESVLRQSMFNVIDMADGGKADFWMLTSEPFDLPRFARRRRETLFGVPAYLSSAEDTILAKLRWSRLSGGSEKQFGDALRVYEVQRPGLDLRYLEAWVEELGVRDLWSRLLAEAVEG